MSQTKDPARRAPRCVPHASKTKKPVGCRTRAGRSSTRSATHEIPSTSTGTSDLLRLAPQGDPQPTTHPQEQTSGTVLCASPQRHTFTRSTPCTHRPITQTSPSTCFPIHPKCPRSAQRRAPPGRIEPAFCKQQHVNWSQHRNTSSVGAMRHSKESPRGTCSPRCPFASRRLRRRHAEASTRFLRGLPAGA